MQIIFLFIESMLIGMASGVSLMAVVYFFYTSYLPNITIEQRKMQAPIYRILTILKYSLLAVVLSYLGFYLYIGEFQLFVMGYSLKLLAVLVIIFLSIAMRRLNFSKFYSGSIVAGSWYFYATNHLATTLSGEYISLALSSIHYVGVLLLSIVIFHVVKTILTNRARVE